MRRELGLHFAGSPEGVRKLTIQRVEVRADGAGRISGTDLRRIPFFFRRRVLLVGIRFDQTDIDGHALPGR